MGVSKNRGTPKMDGENNRNPYFLMDDLGGKPTIFGNIHMKECPKKSYVSFFSSTHVTQPPADAEFFTSVACESTSPHLALRVTFFSHHVRSSPQTLRTFLVTKKWGTQINSSDSCESPRHQSSYSQLMIGVSNHLLSIILGSITILRRWLDA